MIYSAPMGRNSKGVKKVIVSEILTILHTDIPPRYRKSLLWFLKRVGEAK